MIKPGESFEAAFWMTGTETEDKITACCRDMESAIKTFARTHGVKIAPATFTVMAPGEDRVPPVPDHIHGQCVTLLVAEARIVGFERQASPAGAFVQDLDPIDRERLRAITRSHAPKDRILSDAQCDEIAERIGPESAGRAIRQAVDSKTVH